MQQRTNSHEESRRPSSYLCISMEITGICKQASRSPAFTTTAGIRLPNAPAHAPDPPLSLSGLCLAAAPSSFLPRTLDKGLVNEESEKERNSLRRQDCNFIALALPFFCSERKVGKRSLSCMCTGNWRVQPVSQHESELWTTQHNFNSLTFL